MIIGRLLRVWAFTMLCVGMLTTATQAQQGPFASGWTLDSNTSELRFQSVKKETVVESSTFALLTGTIDESGKADITIALDSVDTGIDLRNVRMRFLFFETFNHPIATITMQLSPDQFADLAAKRRIKLALPYVLSIHGIQNAAEAEVVVTHLSDDVVSVASGTPISVSAATFALDTGVKKLEEAATVDIVPSATVSFDFLFRRNVPTGNMSTAAAAVVAASAPTAAPAPSLENAALEAEGDFSPEACTGRFEILSRSGNIFFRSGSAVLDNQSGPMLDSVQGIISRCPGMVIEISGHTDTRGSAVENQRLSERRASAVATYLKKEGINASQVVVKGYGETRPRFPEDTPENMARNRRIEFAVIN